MEDLFTGCNIISKQKTKVRDLFLVVWLLGLGRGGGVEVTVVTCCLKI